MGEGGGAEGEGEAGAGSFDVEALVALRHDRKGRVEFLVRWKTYDATHDTWEPLENLEGTADRAIEDYYATHPQTCGFDCLEGDSRNEHDLSNEFSSAVTSFYQSPSLEAYLAVTASRPSTLSQRQLYDDAFSWLRKAAVVAVAEAERKFQRDSSSPEVRDADLKYFRVMVDLCTAKEVHGSAGIDSKGLVLLLQKILPLRPHCLLWAARSHPFDLSELLERIAEALTPSDPAMVASLARSQLLSLGGHIGRQARLAWATGPETAARVAASATVDEQGERLLAGLRSLADEDDFVGTISPKKSRQRKKRPIPAAGPKRSTKRPLEATLSGQTTVGSGGGGEAQAGAGGGDGATQKAAAEEEDPGPATKMQRVDGAEAEEGQAADGSGAVAMATEPVAPAKLAEPPVGSASEPVASAAPEPNATEAAISSDGKGSDNGDGEEQDSEGGDDDDSEEEVIPRATRSRATLGAATDRESIGEDDDVEDATDKKARNEMEFVGQRDPAYTWRPLDTPMNVAGFGTTVLRCSTHSAAADVLLAITDLVMLVTRKDRVFANKKLPGLKSWLETHGVPIWYYGFRPRGWTDGDERSDTQEYRGNMTPCLAYKNVRYVLRWLCGGKGRSGDLVASWKAAGGRQWLQAEIETSTGNGNGSNVPGQVASGGGDAAIAALRARFHRQTEQDLLAQEAKQKERLPQALKRWHQLLCRAAGRATARAAVAGAAAGSTDAAASAQADEESCDWPAVRRPVWLRELHGRPVEVSTGVKETLAELSRALRRAGGFPLYRSTTGLLEQPPPVDLPSDTSLAATAKESEIAELPAADQALVRLVLLTGTDAEAEARGSLHNEPPKSNVETDPVEKLREWLQSKRQNT